MSSVDEGVDEIQQQLEINLHISRMDEIQQQLEHNEHLSRRQLRVLVAPLNVCAVCELAFENRRDLRQHVRTVHCADLDALRTQIQDIEAIPADNRTDTQVYNLNVFRRRRAFLRPFRALA
jgi:hypothetical protein